MAALTPVTSSQIHAVGYDEPTKTLTVQFKSKGGPGSTYTYSGVPAEVHQGLMGAESKGKFFGERIKKAGFKYAKGGK